MVIKFTNKNIPNRLSLLFITVTVLSISFSDLLQSQTSSPIEKVITNGSREQRRVALTFDACPAHDMKVDWGVVNALIETKTPATLFLSGRWMEKFPEETKRLAQVPEFEIALHSYSHPHMTRLSEEAIAEQLTKNQNILRELTG